MEARPRAMRNFFRNPRVFRSGSATRHPASPDARSGELSPRRTAAGTRSPSRARRVCKIARQVFVEAGHGALPARHLRRPGMRRTGAWATWVHPRKMRMAPCHIQPVRPPSTSPAWGSCRPTHDLPPLQRNPRRAILKHTPRMTAYHAPHLEIPPAKQPGAGSLRGASPSIGKNGGACYRSRSPPPTADSRPYSPTSSGYGFTFSLSHHRSGLVSRPTEKCR
jgi:hypothetical protein